MPSNPPDPGTIQTKSNFRIAATYIIGYLTFTASLLLVVILLFRIRMNIVQIAFLLGKNQVEVKGLANFGVLISGIILLAGIIFSEDYLRKGIEKNRMWKHLLRIFLVEGTAVMISLGLYFLVSQFFA